MTRPVEAIASIHRRVASRVAWGAGAVFLLVMAAGADRPPPPGFALVVVLAGAVVWALHRLLPRLLADWQSEGARHALIRAGALGLGAGAAVWGIASVARLGDSPDVPFGAAVVGFIVVSFAAAVAALIVVVVARRLVVLELRRARRDAGPGPDDGCRRH